MKCEMFYFRGDSSVQSLQLSSVQFSSVQFSSVQFSPPPPAAGVDRSSLGLSQGDSTDLCHPNRMHPPSPQFEFWIMLSVEMQKKSVTCFHFFRFPRFWRQPTFFGRFHFFPLPAGQVPCRMVQSVTWRGQILPEFGQNWTQIWARFAPNLSLTWS